MVKLSRLIQYSVSEIQSLNIDNWPKARYTLSTLKSSKPVGIIIHATFETR